MSDDNKRTAEVVPGDPTATGTAVSVDAVGGVGGETGDENPEGHKNVEVDGVGAVDSDENPPRHKTVDVEAPLKNELGPDTQTWGDGGRQHSPVGGDNASVLGASERKSLQILPAPEPEKRVKVDAPIRGEIGDPTKTFPRDRGRNPDHAVTNDAFPSEGGVEGVEKGTPDNRPFPPEGGVEPRGKGTPDSRGASAKKQIMAALKVTRAEIALGIRTAETEFDRLAELENEPIERLQAMLDSYSAVKEAGLKKTGSTSKTANFGSLPSLQQAHVHESSLRQVESKDETVELAETIFG